MVHSAGQLALLLGIAMDLMHFLFLLLVFDCSVIDEMMK